MTVVRLRCCKSTTHLNLRSMRAVVSSGPEGPLPGPHAGPTTGPASNRRISPICALPAMRAELRVRERHFARQWRDRAVKGDRCDFSMPPRTGLP